MKKYFRVEYDFYVGDGDEDFVQNYIFTSEDYEGKVALSARAVYDTYKENELDKIKECLSLDGDDLYFEAPSCHWTTLPLSTPFDYWDEITKEEYKVFEKAFEITGSSSNDAMFHEIAEEFLSDFLKENDPQEVKKLVKEKTGFDLDVDYFRN